LKSIFQHMLAAVFVFYTFFYSSSAAQEDTAGNTDTCAAEAKSTVSLTIPVEFTDTIPGDFFQIVDRLGLNSYTLRLITRFETISEELILESLAQANKQVDYQRANAFAVAYAINLFCQMDSLWAEFFSDIEMQYREPNILRINFRDDQKWKSYALNELFYSEFFQELLLIMGNIGIADSRDGKQWLAGWPDELRWKYHEYRFEYMPEDIEIRVIDLRKAAGGTSDDEETSTVRLLPSKPVLSVEPGDSVEPPLRVPRP
jgi:hypothetical protein